MLASLSSTPAATEVVAGARISRIVFGAARLTRAHGWGVPAEPEASRQLLREAVEAGITHIDTADGLGPGVSETLIGETFAGREDVLISTKVGMLRPAPDRWGVLGHPDYLRQQVHASLNRLRRERIDLLYLHRIDPAYPLADQIGALQELRDAGHIGHLGVSEPTLDQLHDVLALEPDLAAVQSLYNLVATGNSAVAQHLAALDIPFVAYWPLIGRGLPTGVRSALFAELERLGRPLGLNAAQVALAWIFTTQPRSLAVVGSTSIHHLIQDTQAAAVRLDPDLVTQIDKVRHAVVASVPFDPRHPQEPQEGRTA